jgi:hypothetical protein
MLNRVLFQQPRHLVLFRLTCGFLLAGVCTGASAAIFSDVPDGYWA